MKEEDSFPLRRNLGKQILIIYFTFVGLVVVGLLLFELFAGRRLEADVWAAQLSLAHAVAQETNAEMANALETVRELAGYPEVMRADTAGMQEVFRTVMSGRSDINLTYRLDAQGMMLFHYPIAPESTVGRDFSFRDYFQAALTADAPLVSNGRISPTTNEAVATAVMPIRDAHNQFLGVVATNLRLQSLSNALTSIAGEFRPEEQFNILIVDASGQVIAHSDAALLLQSGLETMPDVVKAVLAQETGDQVAFDEKGVERLYGFVPISNIGWGVVVSRPTAVAFATLYAFRRGAIVAIAVFLGSGVLFWIALSRRVIKPLEMLAEFSQSLREGQALSAEFRSSSDMSSLTSRPDQMGLLMRSLTSMQQAIEARLNELSTLLDTSAAVVSSLDQQTVLDRILEQVERLMGVQMSAIFAQDAAKGIFRVYASRGLPDWYVERATVNPNDPGSVTMRTIRSGQPIQISDTMTNPSYTLYRERARSAGYRSVLAVPLPAQYTPPAALLVFRPDVHQFSSREINLLSSFANHATMAIENAALYAHSDMRLQEQTRRLEALIQSMQDGLILENLDGHVMYANRTIEVLSGMKLEAIRGQSVEMLMDRILQHVRDKEAVWYAIAAALEGGRARRLQFSMEGPDKTSYWRLKLFDVTDPEGTLMGRGRILQDITQRYEVDRMKSSLISTVSHELRTPLAAIKGYATTLLADDVKWDDDSQHEFLNIISNETDHLSQLVDDLLDMSRIEAGSLTVSRSACDLSELVQRAAQRAHPRPGARLHVQLPPDMPPLYADPKRIEAVLRNLIENAAKYSGEASPIYVQAEVGETAVTIRIIDEGPGIPPEHGRNIFTSFYRIDNGMTRRTSGAGLGLSISRGFVQAHGGQILMEPRETGTCIAFSLPMLMERIERDE